MPDGVDDVGPSGRLIPKGGEEDPGEILRRLKDAKLASDDIEHWSVGTRGDGKVYLNDDGEACKIDKRGVPCKVGSDGRRILLSRRPKHLYSPEEWDKLDAKTKKKAYRKAKREKARDAKLSRKRAAVGKRMVGKILDNMIFPKIVQFDKIDLELGSHCAEGWEWALESAQQQLQDEFLADVVPAVPAGVVFDDNWIPAMAGTTSVQQNHHTKNGAHGRCFNAMVTRPVTRKEMLSNPKAMEAFMKEWKGLWEQEVFDFSQTRQYDDVVSEAKRKGQKVHMARVHGLIYEKNYQLKEDDPARKFKGRGVLLGDQVKDQNMEAALFQDLGNSPATFDASRWADYYGCLAGNDVQMADAIFRHTFRRSCPVHRVGLSCLMKPGILQQIVETTVDPYAVWSKPYMMPIWTSRRWYHVGATLSHRSTKSRFQTTWGRMAVALFPSRNETVAGDLRR